MKKILCLEIRPIKHNWVHKWKVQSMKYGEAELKHWVQMERDVWSSIICEHGGLPSESQIALLFGLPWLVQTSDDSEIDLFLLYCNSIAWPGSGFSLILSV